MSLGPLMIDLLGKELLAEEHALIQHPLVGGVILFTRNFESRTQVEQLVSDIRSVRGGPFLIAVDYEGGRVQRFRKDFTVLPPLRLLGTVYDSNPEAGLTLSKQFGWLLAAELRATGIDLSFGPVVDLDYGASTVIGDRSFHRDPQIVAQLATSMMQGMREAGLAAVAKHFPGHGAVVADSHVALPVDHRPYSALAEDISPYTHLMHHQLPALMAAHVVFDQVDSLPASFSRRWLVEELRHKMKFTGAVFSDDLSMEGASIIGDMPARAQTALSAGCDMVLICNNREAALKTLQQLTVVPDPVSMARLAKVHGAGGLTHPQLMASPQWQQTQAVIADYRDRLA